MIFRAYAVTLPGLEPVLRQELSELGLQPHGNQEGHPGGEETGGLEFQASLSDVYRANLLLRCATRVIIRIGSFTAVGFDEFNRKAGQQSWRSYLHPGQPLALRVTCRKSRLYHSGAVARELAAAIGRAMDVPVPIVDYSEDNPEGAQLVVARLVHDRCTISLDSSGSSLHRRGYRLASAKAPLRETLAAGILIASGWDRVSPLVDPFCGSGTIPIEAAMLARRVPPGQVRHFAFERWPEFDADLWGRLLKDCAQGTEAGCPPIMASDRDAGAVRTTQENAGRAGVEQDLDIQCQAFSAIRPPGAIPGWIVTNPPFGQRVSAGRDLRNLYDQLGTVLRGQFPGWHVSLLCADPVMAARTRLPFQAPLRLVTGGLPVGLYSARIEA